MRSGLTACALAACGAGVAVVDHLTARTWRGPGLGFLGVRGGPAFPAFAVRNANLAPSPLVQEFVARVQAGFHMGAPREGGNSSHMTS